MSKRKNRVVEAIVYGVVDVLGAIAPVIGNVIVFLGLDHGPLRISFYPNGLEIAADLHRGRSHHIYRVRLSDGKATRVSKSGANEYGPKVSPDGELIAYAAPGGKDIQIFVMNADRTDARRLTFNDDSEGSPSFSPDGSRLVFYRAYLYREAHMGGYRWNDVDIVTIGIDGTDERRLTHEKFYSISTPQFSPDGHTVVFAAYGGTSRRAEGRKGTHIAALNVESGALIWLTDGPQHPDSDFHSFGNSEPCVSPDGKSIVFTSDRGKAYEWNVWIMDADGSNARQITRGASNCSSPRFFPDGKSVLFLKDTVGGGGFNVWKVGVEGGEAQRLLNGRVLRG